MILYRDICMDMLYSDGDLPCQPLMKNTWTAQLKALPHHLMANYHNLTTKIN